MLQYRVQCVVSGERAVVDMFEAMNDVDAITVFKSSYRPHPENRFELERGARIVYELGHLRPARSS